MRRGMIMYEEEFKRIIEASQNKTLTFFVGAGVSALSGAPSWKKLIEDICNEMGVYHGNYYASDEFLKIPQMYYYSLDEKDREEKYRKFIEKRINVPGLKTNDIHKEMLKLNPVSFITTNYDSLIEDSAMEEWI